MAPPQKARLLEAKEIAGCCEPIRSTMMPPSSNPYSLAGGACFALAGAACDLRWRRIPNRLTGAALLTALAVNTYVGGLRGLLDSLAACLLAGGAFAVMFFMGGMGGGDVKLMAAIAAFAGLAHLLCTSAGYRAGRRCVCSGSGHRSRGPRRYSAQPLAAGLLPRQTRGGRFLPTCPPLPALRGANCGGRTAHFL